MIVAKKSRKYKTILFFLTIGIILMLIITHLFLMTYNNRVYTFLCESISSSEYEPTGRFDEYGRWKEKGANITFNKRINGFTLKKVITKLEEEKIDIPYVYVNSDDVEYTTEKIMAFDWYDENGIFKSGGRVSGIDFYSWEYEPEEIIDIESSHDLEDKISSLKKYNVAIYITNTQHKTIIIYDDNFDLFKGYDE